jgi:hypothetical protein
MLHCHYKSDGLDTALEEAKINLNNDGRNMQQFAIKLGQLSHCLEQLPSSSSVQYFLLVGSVPSPQYAQWNFYGQSAID